MASRTVLVTGAGGFVGRHLMARLARDLPQAALHASDFDVTHPAAVEEAIRSLQPDCCVHLAAIAAIPQARDDPEQAWAVNLGGTLTLARAILAHAPDCRLVYASSSDIYGASFASGQALDERAVLAPLNTYAATKAAADLAIGAMVADGLRAVRLRPFNHTGPGQSDSFVVSAFAAQVQRIRDGRQAPVLRVGSLEARRDFLDVRDVVGAYAACVAAAELPEGAILNVASGEPRRIGDILDGLLTAAGVRAQVEVEPSRLRRMDIPVACGDASAVRALLGWAPEIAWEQTITDVLSDWRDRA